MSRDNNRMSLWGITDEGSVFQCGGGTRLNVATTRALVAASSPDDAVAAMHEQSFHVGIKNAKEDEPAEILISGFIGDSWNQSDARSVQTFLRNNRGKPVVVRINSGGGLAWDGIAMHNAFFNHDALVTCVIEAMAGSAASVAAVGCENVKIYDNAQFFMHRAAGMVFGNRDAMTEAIDFLDAMDESIAKSYKAKSGKAIDKIHALMRGKFDGTTLNAKDAVTNKFCDEVIPLKRTATNSVVEPTNNADMMYVEAARARRMRAHAGLFVPAGSSVETP